MCVSSSRFASCTETAKSWSPRRNEIIELFAAYCSLLIILAHTHTHTARTLTLFGRLSRRANCGCKMWRHRHWMGVKCMSKFQYFHCCCVPMLCTLHGRNAKSKQAGTEFRAESHRGTHNQTKRRKSNNTYKNDIHLPRMGIYFWLSDQHFGYNLNVQDHRYFLYLNCEVSHLPILPSNIFAAQLAFLYDCSVSSTAHCSRFHLVKKETTNSKHITLQLILQAC